MTTTRRHKNLLLNSSDTLGEKAFQILLAPLVQAKGMTESAQDAVAYGYSRSFAPSRPTNLRKLSRMLRIAAGERPLPKSTRRKVQEGQGARA